ncbi:DUF1697 domain-containing protein [Algibacter pectinivorans]|uniref:Uncharacterized conserved protein, DUF1697 family n=1 Tax=Algibacter pectinivorans TaxID=870482 RepID=A0A1I1MP62_9FLAO|nr:DUF1697 domain-containing protein [Algibacter pectinivorans]SFC84413.1 Uncharacterized conserved protein, DUF1697 family [Algibacter pectinivorans]
MNTYIALLRGINVSGKHKIPMAELRGLLLKEGLVNVQTYIQTGNVIFQSSEGEEASLETTIYNAIKSHFGFEVPILVLTPKELQYVFDSCPFLEEQKEKSYFMLLYSKPDAKLVEDVSKLSFPNETFYIINKVVYLYSSVGYGKAKCSNNFFERKLKITATARNYKTMVKLLSLSADN